MSLAGIILAGGKSSRMGRPKAWLPIGEETSLQRIARIVQSGADPVVVVAAKDQELPLLSSKIVILRDEREALGPLGGMAVGLNYLSNLPGVETAFVTGCDLPLLKPEFLRWMSELMGDHEIVIPKTGGYHHPLAAIYRVDLSGRVEHLVNENRLRPIYLLEETNVRKVSELEICQIDPELDCLRNMNTPEDYAGILARVSEQR